MTFDTDGVTQNEVLLPKGRDEEGLVYGMEWVRHHDKYGEPSFVDPYTSKLRSAGGDGDAGAPLA